MPELDHNQANLYKNFGASNWLSSPHNVRQLILWTTYYRRNLHRFAMDYLGLSLHWYQMFVLYFMGISTFIVWVAARASAKSYVIAIYSVCKAILYPMSNIVLTAGTRGQSKLIVTDKIISTFMRLSPNLCREIEYTKNSQNEVEVVFRNGSRIFTVTCNRNSRGGRSTENVGEEAREIDKSIMDEIISPFKVVRNPDYLTLPEYAGDERLLEQAKDIFITSSFSDSCWVNKAATDAIKGMMEGNGSFFMALDYSITLKHNIRTRQQLIQEKRQLDDLTWAVEYENVVLRSNAASYFKYDEVTARQTISLPWYPRKNSDVINRKTNKYDIAKQPGEIRVVSCDIAAINRSANDNSVFACLRLFPETVQVGTREQKEFRIQVPYLEANRGAEVKRQAIRIRQLFEDFHADYIVLDVRNIGLSIADALARVLYDDERNVEYPPIKCMNDDVIAARINSPDAKQCLFAIAASQKLNSEIAVSMKTCITSGTIDFLVSKESGVENLARVSPEYLKAVDPEDRLFFERPYFETMALVSEMVRLQYERKENTGLIVLRERGAEMKDRYTAVSYGAYFTSLLARDLLSDADNADYYDLSMLVTSVDF